MPSGATSGGVGGSVTSASLLKLQQQQQQQTAVPLQQQQPSTNAPQPPFNQVNKFILENDELFIKSYLSSFILFYNVKVFTMAHINAILYLMTRCDYNHMSHVLTNS